MILAYNLEKKKFESYPYKYSICLVKPSFFLRELSFTILLNILSIFSFNWSIKGLPLGDTGP